MAGQPMASSSERTARLNMRLTPEALETLREAAAAQQQDVTSFVLGAAMEHARDVVMQQRVMLLTAREVAQVDEALERQPTAVPELAALIADMREQRVRPAAPTAR